MLNALANDPLCIAFVHAMHGCKPKATIGIPLPQPAFHCMSSLPVADSTWQARPHQAHAPLPPSRWPAGQLQP